MKVAKCVLISPLISAGKGDTANNLELAGIVSLQTCLCPWSKPGITPAKYTRLQLIDNRSHLQG